MRTTQVATPTAPMSMTTSPIASTGSRCPTTITVAPAAARSAMARSTRSFGRPVEVRGGLVEQQHRRRRAEHPGQSETLALTERQADAAAADHGVQTVGKFGQNIVETRRAAGGRRRRAAARTARGCRARCRGSSTGRCASHATLDHHCCRSSSATSIPLMRRGAGGEAEDRPAAAWSCRCRWDPSGPSPGRVPRRRPSMSHGQRARAPPAVPAGAEVCRIDEPKSGLHGRLSVLRGVERRADAAQRPEHLRREQQRGEAGGQRHLAVHQAHARR